MVKKFLIISTLAILSNTVYAQYTKTEAVVVQKNTVDSNSAKNIKFEDIKLSDLKYTLGTAETRIRKIPNGNTFTYIFQIVIEDKTFEPFPDIKYSDILKVLKEITTLKKEEKEDFLLAFNKLKDNFKSFDGMESKQFIYNYRGNKYKLRGGLMVGYETVEGKTSWLIRNDNSKSDNNTILFESAEPIEAIFTEAKKKMEELNRMKK
ncbi:MAG TPA: hypothetical protein VLZ75_02255 [Chitinophagales bacterium]|nr:hypothetical protein [Chitinophagales bacterium]